MISPEGIPVFGGIDRVNQENVKFRDHLAGLCKPGQKTDTNFLLGAGHEIKLIARNLFKLMKEGKVKAELMQEPIDPRAKTTDGFGSVGEIINVIKSKGCYSIDNVSLVDLSGAPTPSTPEPRIVGRTQALQDILTQLRDTQLQSAAFREQQQRARQATTSPTLGPQL